MLDGREREAALVAAVGALRRRERTVAELRTWLGDRVAPAELVEETIGELVAAGELDDERFAHAFAADKRELSGWGPQRIEAALLDRGVERSLSERAGGENREEQLERATALIAGRSMPLGAERERARALALLLRRGFDYELAYDAVRRAERRLRAA